MAAAKLAVLLAMAVLLAVAGAAAPQEAQCWQCYTSCIQNKCNGYHDAAAHTAVDDGAAAASVPVNSTVGTAAIVHPSYGGAAVDDGAAAASVPVSNSTDGIAANVHPTDGGGAAAHVAGWNENYCKCNKACIVDCYKSLPPVCYQMCVSQTCVKLPPCKQADCYKACGEKCYHKQPSPGPKPPSPNPGPKPPGPKPTPPKPAPPNHGSPRTPPVPPKRPCACPPNAPKPKPKPTPCPPKPKLKPKPKPKPPCPPAGSGSASTNISISNN